MEHGTQPMKTLKMQLQRLRHNLSKILADFLENRARKIIQNNGVWKYLGPYFEKSSVVLKGLDISYLDKGKTTGCDYVDYLYLFNYIRKNKPRWVLECGTGSSTIVIAYALMLNGGGKVVSMEDQKEYHEWAKETFPPELKEFVEFKLSPAIEKKRDFFRGSGYKDIPKHDYEFVFIDGPDLLVALHFDFDDLAFNYDFIEAVQISNKPVSGLVDTRTSTSFVYSMILGDKFRYNYLQRQGLMFQCTKKDLLNAQQITARAMKRHAFKRPSFLKVKNL